MCRMTDLLSFLGLCLLITITPGLDTAVVIRSVVNGGRNAGLRTAAGCAAGLFVHAVAVALGLAEFLVRSATAFEMVKFCGAVLLVILGGRSLWAAWKARGSAADVVAAEEARKPRGSTPFLQGLFNNLGNPKATLFFLASLPQFIPDDRPSAAVPVALMLAGIAVIFQMTGLGLTAVAANRLRRVLKSPRMRRAPDAARGATLVALGVRVALE
jgi:threonine/homoserine/homoserine lactone efflux protein